MAEDVPLFDFESGDLEDWEIDGERDEYALRVVETDAAADWEYDTVGWEGDYLLAAGEGRHEFHEDVVLRSPGFEVEREYLRFLLAGELNPRVCVGLLVDGERVRVAYGNNDYDGTPRGWDVSDLRGETARLEVRDVHPRRSLLRLDDVRLSDEAPPEPGSFGVEDRAKSDLVRTGEFELLFDAAELDGVAEAVGAEDEVAVYYCDLVFGHDERWHCYASVAPVQDEYDNQDTCTDVVHASADELTGDWTVHGICLSADERVGDTHAAQPHVVYDDGLYHMFYVGEMNPFRGFFEVRPNEPEMWDGGYGPVGPNRVHLAVSEDGEEWVRHPHNPLFGEDAFCYDPYVTRVDGEWAVYYEVTDDDTPEGKQSLARRTSEDLLHWSDRELVFRHEEAAEGWSESRSCENPSVVRRGVTWYLLTGNIDDVVPSRFHVSRVFRSRDPTDFPDAGDDGLVFVDGGASPVRDADGDWYVTHANAMSGGVWLAPLHWNDGLERQPTSVPTPAED